MTKSHATYVQFKPLMKALVMHTLDFLMTLKTNRGKVLHMLAAYRLHLSLKKEERNNLIALDIVGISYSMYGSMLS